MMESYDEVYEYVFFHWRERDAMVRRAWGHE